MLDLEQTVVLVNGLHDFVDVWKKLDLQKLRQFLSALFKRAALRAFHCLHHVCLVLYDVRAEERKHVLGGEMVRFYVAVQPFLVHDVQWVLFEQRLDVEEVLQQLLVLRVLYLRYRVVH